jgi:phospholipid/cholesterol/gamma-HCH transport system permease protein
MHLPSKFRQFLNETGGMTVFRGSFFSQEFKPRFEFRELISKCYIIGYNSLSLVGLTGFIMGLVLTMQLRPSLVVYGVHSQLPLMLGVAIVRGSGRLSRHSSLRVRSAAELGRNWARWGEGTDRWDGGGWYQSF